MKKFRVIERRDDYNSAHYIECNVCEQISPFAVKIENEFTIIFMDQVIEVEECK